ncbi:MAG: cisplatin damage response ATP-dependent DNA ligase [Hyphomonadaceae bacterium]|jgi:DNA ligase-1|nr:cisplatin damage response ATP-dependent DNA ligase [Hyphomonadaceae bacterium]
MKAFADLLDRLSYSPGRNTKLRLMQDYFRATPDPDRGWALATLTDGLPFSFPLRRTLSDMMARRMDGELFRLSRDYVGDTAETIALVWDGAGSLSPSRRGEGHDGAVPPARGEGQLHTPAPASTPHPSPLPASGERGQAADGEREPPRLSDIVSELALIGRNDLRPRLELWLDALDATGRWALLKLLTGALRVGVSARLAKTAVADMAGYKVDDVEEVWHGLAPPYDALFAWLEGRAAKPDVANAPVFRPLMLSHALEDADWAALDLAQFSAEWKWDGIRVQIVAAGGVARLYSRTGDDIGRAFPDIVNGLRFNAVLDGELLVVRDGQVAPFNDLQQRLNRKGVSLKQLEAFPAHVRLYDALLIEGEDLRGLPFTERRARLEAWFSNVHPPRTDLSPIIQVDGKAELRRLWSETRATSIEGIMLKRAASRYVAGRPKGEWYKWKRAPLTLDCVLMYAQRGSGKRSSYYSDYTFGAWRTDVESGVQELVPVGKAYFGFTDEELLQIDRWVRNHTTESFGPVRAVSPELVFEVAFDAVQRSTRHKSGVAMRFPRIHRIRWDKPAAEADRLETLLAMIEA